MRRPHAQLGRRPAPTAADDLAVLASTAGRWKRRRWPSSWPEATEQASCRSPASAPATMTAGMPIGLAPASGAVPMGVATDSGPRSRTTTADAPQLSAFRALVSKEQPPRSVTTTAPLQLMLSSGAHASAGVASNASSPRGGDVLVGKLAPNSAVTHVCRWYSVAFETSTSPPDAHHRVPCFTTNQAHSELTDDEKAAVAAAVANQDKADNNKRVVAVRFMLTTPRLEHATPSPWLLPPFAWLPGQQGKLL
mmetsp:Transcript_44309/g.120725  ORF Transcript_44309/g.120725 Transcript_44309/m.120725 type:complete len:251 (+) Transcript_44309:1878-2630(+)